MNASSDLETRSRDESTDITRTVAPGSKDDPVELANRLRPVILQLSRHLRRELHSLGVTGGQASLLAAIQGSPGIGVKELSEREGASGSSICVQIDKLEAAGLVERERAAGSDRRRVLLRVTGDGTRVLRAVRSRRTAWLASRLEKMSAGQRRDIDLALTALTGLIPHGEPS
jgi:DNA-binding MarR family transcriptional regulator